MFRGLSAFPLTPLTADTLDEQAFIALITRLREASVDSITVLGSTGSYAYLTREERKRTIELAVAHAGEVPVIAGIGALRTSHVRTFADDAQAAGSSGVLLAPMSYQPLTPDDVLGLYSDVTRDLSVPLAVYDNPGTTHFSFTDDLYAELADLPQVASIKIPGVPTNPEEAASRIKELRRFVPGRVTLGVSGDAHGAEGLIAGCEAWYSVIGGTLPQHALTITRAAQRGDAEGARAEFERLEPLWRLFGQHGGSLRVVAALAEELGLAERSCLPLPIRGLSDNARAELRLIMTELELTRD